MGESTAMCIDLFLPVNFWSNKLLCKMRNVVPVGITSFFSATIHPPEFYNSIDPNKDD